MYLKNLEIVGFKSFADRVKLDFEPGITAVVGPNGCGKSNIMDALRWCLGEMSVKSLRSSMMMDVVFNGSGSRPPQNMAEVTLTFDNSDKRLPIDYTDVAITRRLFRSGESEYFINRTQCRLRDIKELFLDTGMGEDGYSCMEQGKVEWILQAKPEERRELFEEAAGVSKYRTRREEALRKLERIEIDLSRLNDIISVTKDQIRKLENAVNRAKTYQRVREELKNLEISDWLFQLKENKQLLSEIENKLKDSSTTSESLNTETHQLEASLANLRLSLTQTEEELLQANQLLVAIDADVKIGEERLTNSQQRERDLIKQLESLRQSIERENMRIKELEALSVQQQATHDQIADKGSSIESDYQTAVLQFNSTLTNLEGKRTSSKELRDLILDRAQERARLQQQMSYLTSDVSRLESLTENLKKEIERIKNEIENQSHLLISVQQQVDEHKKTLLEKTNYLEELNRQQSKLHSEENEIRELILSVSEDIARLKGQIHSIESQQSQDPYLSGVQAILSAGIPRIYGPLNRLFQCGQNDRDLMAATIGEQLGDLVADTSDDAEAAINYLAQHGKGRARIWILDKLPSRPTFFGSLMQGETLSKKIQCEEKYKPLLTHLASNLLVKGTTIYGTGVINGGVDPSRWKSHTTHRLPELQELLTEKERSKTTYESSLSANATKQSSLVSQRDSAVKEMEEFRIRLELMDEESIKVEKKIALLSEELQVVEKELQLNSEDKQKAVLSHQSAQDQFNSLQSTEQNDHERLDVLHQEISELQLIHANANADLSNKKEKHQQFIDQLAWQKGVLDHTRQELTHLKSSISEHLKAISTIDQEFEVSRNTQDEARLLIQTSLEKRQAASGAVSHVQGKRLKLSGEIQSTEKTLHQVRMDWNAIQQVIQENKILESTIHGKIDSLVQKLFEQYELTPEIAHQSFPTQMADAETLDRLKKRVAGMGPINLAAPQEHAELLEKDNFMSSQQADLLKAKDDLRQAITKINATTREHFKETYEKVRENFRTIYGQLFQGGEADLKLTDEADILSAGVDIYCQPPGKKLLHISLLSGGEKALTACALLFAFFQVRPSPVALLDEVDAPLDEANVLRFVDLIKIFSEKSQFILISHNKRTMEAANNLYGITMEELGVSKILSARLQKDKKKIEASIEPEPAAV